MIYGSFADFAALARLSPSPGFGLDEKRKSCYKHMLRRLAGFRPDVDFLPLRWADLHHR
jgi:hypothetical protein